MTIFRRLVIIAVVPLFALGLASGCHSSDALDNCRLVTGFLNETPGAHYTTTRWYNVFTQGAWFSRCEHVDYLIGHHVCTWIHHETHQYGGQGPGGSFTCPTPAATQQ